MDQIYSENDHEYLESDVICKRKTIVLGTRVLTVSFTQQIIKFNLKF